MPLSAWIMLIVGSVIFYGGLGASIAIAIKSKKR